MDGLRRYVLPSSSEPVLDPSGFLGLPTDTWWQESERRPIPVQDLAGDPGFALLAAGGAGKTSAFKALAKKDATARYVDTSHLTLPELRQELEEALQTRTPIYLDSLDEALDGATPVFRWLMQAVEDADPAKLRLRLACRSVVWRASIAATLRSRTPGFRELKLLPMDRATAGIVVSEAGVDGATFLDAIATAGLGRLAANPSQLLATATYWSIEGHLPASPLDAMTFEVNRLIEESDDQRPAHMPQERLLRIAGRLATFAAFGETSLFGAGPAGGRAVFSIDALPADAEPTELGRAVEPTDYRQVLTTALFDPAPHGTVAFRHRQYLEYLAANYLVQRRIARAQVPALLGVHANGLIPAERAGVAAWLGSLAPELVEDLLSDNALMFGSATAELRTDRARAAVVEGLLVSAAEEDQRPGWGVEFSALVHPELADQLESRLSAGLRTSDELWWLAGLAQAGNCRGLVDHLVQSALNAKWYPYARRAAAKAVGALGVDADRLALADLLRRDPAEDVDNEVFATVLDLLYPEHLQTSELVEVLRPNRTHVIYGAYFQTLRNIAVRVPDADLVMFTSWFASRPTDKGEHLDDLTVGLIQRTWKVSDDPDIRGCLADLVVSNVKAGRWRRVSFNRIERSPWLEGPAERRRELALAVAAAGGGSTLRTAELLLDEDVEWMLDAVPSLPPAPAQQLATCLLPHLWEPTAAVADRVLTMPPTHPAYAVTSHFRASVALDSAQAAQGREDAAAAAAAQAEADAAQAEVLETLTSAEDDGSTFPGLVYDLAWPQVHGDQALLQHDLTTFAGWTGLTQQQQKQVLLLGTRYVEPEPVPAETDDPDLLPALAAIHLLATLQQHAPEQLSALGPQVWERWLHALVSTPVSSAEGSGAARQALLDAVPTQLRAELQDAAMFHLDRCAETNDGFIRPPAVYEHLAQVLAPKLADRIITQTYSPGFSSQVLALLVEHGPAAIALDTCQQLATSPDAARATLAIPYLAALDPNQFVDTFLPPTLWPEDLTARVSHLNVPGLDASHLKRAARILLDVLPYESDPPLTAGFAFQAQHNGRDVRTAVLRRLAEDGHASALDSLKSGRSDVDRQMIAEYHRTAKAREADLAATITSPHAVLELLRSSDARLIRNDADLCDVLVAGLDRLQHQLTYDGAFREVWNGQSPQSEDDISDWIRRRLDEALASGVLVDRELQVLRRKDKGVGTRIDLTATAPTSAAASSARVIVEAKLANNGELKTAMHAQLIDRYLVPTKNTRGIYLVYWVTPDQRPPGWTKSADTTVQGLLDELAQQAATAPSGIEVRPYVLDISRPS